MNQTVYKEDLKMLKRVVSLLLVLVFVATLIAACSKNESGADKSSTVSQTDKSSEQSEEKKPQEKKPQTISLAHSQGEWLWPVIEEVVAKYHDLSGNTVELLTVPSETMFEWTKAQFAGNTAPDILWGGFEDMAAMAKGITNKWIVDLKPYFEAENPYTGQIWKDSFINGVLDGCIDPNLGNAYLGVPLSANAVNLYYNKDIFKELGIPDKAPESWSEVLEICKKIKDSGKDIIPFSAQNSINWNLDWQRRWMMNDLWDDVVEQLDIIQPDGILQISEQALGVKTGVIDPADPRMIDYFKFMKEFCKCLNEGFNTASWEYEALFNEGKSAMTLNGSWYANQIKTTPGMVAPNYGVGPVPYVDKKISSYSVGVARKLNLGQVNPTFFVTQKCLDEGRIDAAIDFLQYLTDPNSGAKFITEQTMWIPVVKGVEVPEELKGIVEGIGDEQMKIPMWSIHAFTTEADQKALVMFQQFYTDDMSAEQFAKEVFKPHVMKYLEIAIQEHPEWRISEFESKVKK